MIKESLMFTVICDRCGIDANVESDYSCWSATDIAREMADAADWQNIGDKDYCPQCLYFDDEVDGWRVREAAKD